MFKVGTSTQHYNFDRFPICIDCSVDYFFAYHSNIIYEIHMSDHVFVDV